LSSGADSFEASSRTTARRLRCYRLLCALTSRRRASLREQDEPSASGSDSVSSNGESSLSPATRRASAPDPSAPCVRQLRGFGRRPFLGHRAPTRHARELARRAQAPNRRMPDSVSDHSAYRFIQSRRQSEAVPSYRADTCCLSGGYSAAKHAANCNSSRRRQPDRLHSNSRRKPHHRHI